MNKIIQIPNYETNSKELFDTIMRQTEWTPMFKRNICHYEHSITELNNVLVKIENHFSRQIIGCFMNYYETGKDHAPYHADKYGCDVCLLSLGTTRILRYKKNETNEKTDFTLNSGDLLFIPNEINNNYKHSLLQRKKINTPRISLLIFFHP
jgi:hypothetical protein